MRHRTERLILRPWESSDAESLYKYARDPDVGPIAGWPAHTSPENSQEIIMTVLQKDESYAVCLREKPEIAIGSIGLLTGEESNFNLPEGEAELGYWIGKPFWGQGLIPEACQGLLAHAFRGLELNIVWSGYFEGNFKSKRVLEKCGFTFYETLENLPWPLMNDFRTQHRMRLAKEDYLLAGL